MRSSITYRSPQLAGPGMGNVHVRIEPVSDAPSFWTMTVGSEYHGVQFMDDFGFAAKISPATFVSLAGGGQH